MKHALCSEWYHTGIIPGSKTPRPPGLRAWGFFLFWGFVASRITFLVDGFNLYHSIVDLHDDTGVNCRWLDIRSLCGSFLSAIGNGAVIDAIYYFSALAYHKETWKPGTVGRHRVLLDALSSTGVLFEPGKFKPKQVDYRCEQCGHAGAMVRHEEKETDVGIASKMIELSIRPSVNGIVLLSGDTDLVPAMRTVHRLSQASLYVMLPYKRYNNAFDRLTTLRFSLTRDHYARHQFPDPIVLPDGTSIAKPLEWY
jgi:uncharacterized LabA/DUF88 family protein